MRADFVDRPARELPPQQSARAPRSRRPRAGLLLTAALATGCMIRSQGPARPFDPHALSQPGWVAVRDVPLVRQENLEDCGAAAAAMVLAYYRHPASVDTLTHEMPVPDGGLAARDVRTLLRRRGLHAFVIEGTVDDLQHELSAGRPVIVGTVDPVDRHRVRSHYQVVVALRGDQVVTLDPAAGWEVTPAHAFQIEWQAAEHTAIVALP